MIARVWRGFAASDKVADYVEHFEQSVLPELRQIDGYQGASIMRRNLGDGVEITVTTFWESMDAIAKFAGNEPEIAVVSPIVQTIMRAFDSTVTHYEIVLDQGRRTTSSTHS